MHINDFGTSSASRTPPKVTVQCLFYGTYYTTYFQNQALKYSMLNGIDTTHNDNTILTLAILILGRSNYND